MNGNVLNRDLSYGNTPSSARSPWGTLLLYARTVRYLEPVQIYTRFLPHPPVKTPHPAPQLRPLTGEWVQPITKYPAQTGRDRFCFLNQEREITSWNDQSAPKLWLYNLHYFEHVNEELVESWIAENPVGKSIGWDPYPTSLRIANWCKWILSGASPEAHVFASVGVQAAWLEKRLERHLLANHLLANAKALLFAGSMFQGANAERWRAAGLRILEQELPRQILTDGAHVERSPMYHSIILEDLLDLCNLSHAFDGVVPDLSKYASRMLGWLQYMTHPDGEISFFNDAALGIAPDPSDLQAYAERLAVLSEPVMLGASGYLRLENDHIVVIFDAAPLGPDYQPGHGHADVLSFEVSCRGRRALVNSGTSTYDPGPVRAFERGTAAHNTIRVDGVDQSEMWAAFRVARRAQPFDVRTDHRSFVEGAHDGYHRLRPRVTHRRRIHFNGDTLIITDRLEGRGQHTVELFYHVAPGADPKIQLDSKLMRKVIPSLYCTGFNESAPNQTVVGHWSGICPVRFETRIDLSRCTDLAPTSLYAPRSKACP
jgi:Heparinase II/III-like protein/Heparinase II/III N-terminus